MKIFIVFIGLLLVNISILSFNADYGKYTYLHRALENIAVESAEFAAISGSDTDARMYAEELLAHTLSSLKNTKLRNYRCEVYYDGEFAVARISMDVENLFRFPFSPVTNIVAERELTFL